MAPVARPVTGRIFTRVALFACLLVVGTLALCLVLILPFQQQVNTEHMRSDAENIAVSIGQVTATALITEDYSAAIDHCAKVLEQSKTLRYVVIARKDGFALVQTREGWRQEQLSGLWTTGGEPLGPFRETGLVQEKVFHFTHPFEYSGIDWGYIHIGVSLEKFNRDTRALHYQAGFVALFCMAGGFLAAVYLARHFTTPIRNLDAVTQRVAQGDLGALASVHTRDELERLAGSFNVMTESLGRARKELLATREYAANIIRSLHEALVVTDTDGRITAINVAAAELLGRAEAEIVGRPVAALFPSSGRDESGKLVPGEVELVDRHGRKVPVLISVATIRDELDQPQGYAYSARDISDRKRVEEAQLAAREAAEDATRAKSAFLATMSHEIRTPMNGILGMTELLLTTELSGKQRGFAETAYSSGRKLLTLLNDILDFSRIEAGKLTLAKAAFDPRAVASEVVRLLSERATAHGVALRSQVQPGVPSAVWGDPIRFNQILVNLVGNALKFTEVGRVDVDIRLVPAPKGTMIRVTVSDTGIGIAPSAHAAIFEPFSQADGPPGSLVQGTGLGLAISRQLVELMGGTLGVESQIGRGSMFWFEIPLETPPAEGGLVIERPKSPPRLSGRVLLAEDNPVNRDVAREMLALLGLSATVVSNGHEALAAFANRDFDLILMDCQMPVLDGFAATRAIRSHEQAREGNSRFVPIIAMTAFALKSDREACLDAGMTDYLSKPFTGNELHSKLALYLTDVSAGLPPAASTRATEAASIEPPRTGPAMADPR